MFVEGEPVHAFCPLSGEMDDRNKAYLTDASLIVETGGKIHKHSRAQIKSVGLRHRIYLIPAIAGGIMAPLGIVALISDFGDLWLLMLVILAGFALMYYGFQGGPSLYVLTPVKDFDIFIPEVNPRIRSFLAYVNWQLKSADDFLYLCLTDDEYVAAVRRGHVESGTRLYMNTSEIRSKPGSHLFRLNVIRQQIKLHFKQESPEAQVRIILANSVDTEILQEL